MTPLESLFNMVWRQCWQVSLLVVLVFGVSKMLERRRSHLTYVLWLVVLAKCLTPPVLQNPAGLFCWISPNDSRTHQANAFVQPGADFACGSVGKYVADSTVTSMDARQSSSSMGKPVDANDGEVALAEPPNTCQSVWASVLCLWAAGIVCFACWGIGQTRSFARQIQEPSLLDDRELQDLIGRLAKRLKIGRRITLRLTKHRIGPAVYGLFRPTIVLPELLVEEMTMENIEPIIMHELIHIRRGDLWANLLETTVQAIWWFNPLVWLACRQVTRSGEACCDEQTVAALGRNPQRYARCLLQVLELKRALRPAPTVPGIRPIDLTAKRLEKIMRLEQGCDARTPIWCWGVFLAALLMVIPGASMVLAETENERESEAESHSMRLADEEILPAVIPAASREVPSGGSPVVCGETMISIQMQIASAPESFFPVDWNVLRTDVETASIEGRQDTEPYINRKATGSARTLVERREALLYSFLDKSEATALLDRVERSPESCRLLMAPTFSFRDGQGASASDKCDRAVLVSHDDEPTIQYIPNGTTVSCRAKTLDDASVWLDLSVTESKVRNVANSHVKNSDGKPVAIDTSELETASYHIALKVECGHTLLLCADSRRAPTEKGARFVMVTPSIRRSAIRKVDVDSDASAKAKDVWELELEDCIEIAMMNSSALRKAGGSFCKKSGERIVSWVRDDAPGAVLESQVTECVSHIIQAYWELYFCQCQHEEAVNARDYAIQVVGDVLAKYGHEPNGKELDAQSREQYFFFRSRVESTFKYRSTAEASLRYLMGLAEEGDRSIRATSAPHCTTPDVDWRVLQQRALETSPAIRRQRVRVKTRATEVARTASRIESRQTVGIREHELLSQDSTKLHARQLELAREQLRLNEMEWEVVQKLDDAVRALYSQSKLAKESRLRLAVARKQVEAARGALQSGTVELDVLLDAQRRHIDAEDAFDQSQTESALATAKLQLQTGALLDAHGVKLLVADRSSRN